jgi:hypothetical protein
VLKHCQRNPAAIVLNHVIPFAWKRTSVTTCAEPSSEDLAKALVWRVLSPSPPVDAGERFGDQALVD